MNVLCRNCSKILPKYIIYEQCYQISLINLYIIKYIKKLKVNIFRFVFLFSSNKTNKKVTDKCPLHFLCASFSKYFLFSRNLLSHHLNLMKLILFIKHFLSICHSVSMNLVIKIVMTYFFRATKIVPKLYCR